MYRPFLIYSEGTIVASIRFSGEIYVRKTSLEALSKIPYCFKVVFIYSFKSASTKFQTCFSFILFSCEKVHIFLDRIL